MWGSTDSGHFYSSFDWISDFKLSYFYIQKYQNRLRSYLRLFSWHTSIAWTACLPEDIALLYGRGHQKPRLKIANKYEVSHWYCRLARTIFYNNKFLLFVYYNICLLFVYYFIILSFYYLNDNNVMSNSYHFIFCVLVGYFCIWVWVS